MKRTSLERIRTTIAISHGGAGTSRIYYQAPCGCLFKAPHHFGFSRLDTSEAAWFKCLEHSGGEAMNESKTRPHCMVCGRFLRWARGYCDECREREEWKELHANGGI